MQLLINISKEIYDRTLPYKDLPIVNNLTNDYPELTHAVANGTPLLEDHGRLIDADAIIAEATEKMKYPSNHKYMECVIAHMNLAPTIIGADKE